MIIFGAEDDDSDDEDDVIGGAYNHHNHNHVDDDKDEDRDEDDDASDYDREYYEPLHESRHELGSSSQAGEYTGKEFEGFSFVAADAAAFAPLTQPGSGSSWDFAFQNESNEDEEDLLIRELGYLGESIIC
jgi:hypothetical protein